MNKLDPSKVKIFHFDCETDYFTPESNITQICTRRDEDKTYFVAYMEKSEFAHNDGPYQKVIPSTSSRHAPKTILEMIDLFVSERLAPKDVPVIMGYNVRNWDKPILEGNRAKFQAAPKLKNWHFFDIAILAQELGYPIGTTQQQLEWSLRVEKLPSNRHTAYADTKVVKEIWERLIQNVADNEEVMSAIKCATVSSLAERRVAAILKAQDPSLIPTREILESIEKTKQEERIPREIIPVIYDLETTGLLENGKTAEHNNPTHRITQIGALILNQDPSTPPEIFESKVDPEMPIPPEATALTGIRNEDVIGKPKIGEGWNLLVTAVKTSRAFARALSEGKEPCILLVGFNNNRFDNVMLERELLTAGIDLKRQLSKGVIKSWDASFLTQTWYTGLPSKPEDRKLQTIAEFEGVREEGAHDALADSQTVYRILKKLAGGLNLHTLLTVAPTLKKPGIGLKEIILNAKVELDKGLNPDHALEIAVRDYRIKETAETSEASKRVQTRASKRKRDEETAPPMEEFTFKNPDSQEAVTSTSVAKSYI
jgi:DNA polymerase III epsilon subunit-like protein